MKLVETNGQQMTDKRTQPLLQLTPQGGQLIMIKIKQVIQNTKTNQQGEVKFIYEINSLIW